MEAHKLAEITAREGMAESRAALRKPFGHEWGVAYFAKWGTISHCFRFLGLREGATVLDVGAGFGWTTVFLAEEGYKPTAVDIAPVGARVGRMRADRYGVKADFQITDMEEMDLGQLFDACLVFDALHHSIRQADAICRIAEHLKPEGWALFAEPSWLHGISRSAAKASRDQGWVERGIRARSLKRDCRRAGFVNFHRFYEGSLPASSLRGLAWQICRLLLTPLSSSPQASIWIAAQKR